MLDSHCHLTDHRIQSQLADALTRAKAAGVSHLITIGTTPADSRRCVELSSRLSNVRCAVGVHPNNVEEVDESELASLRDIQANPSVVALGEMGLDYHYGKDFRDRQAKFFETQLQLATELNRPVVIHCREAVDDCLAIMAKFPAVGAVYHCFTGTLAESKKILDAGYYLGFTGVVTYRNAGELVAVVDQTPMDRLLVETDAPYLSPEPMRKVKVNEPAFVTHTAARVAQIKGVTVTELGEKTTANANRLFGWPG